MGQLQIYCGTITINWEMNIPTVLGNPGNRFPKVPAFAEYGPAGYVDAPACCRLSVPAGTPVQTIAHLSNMVKQVPHEEKTRIS